jgi:hypothetical protein
MNTMRKLLTGLFVIIALVTAFIIWLGYVAVWYQWQGVIGGLIGLFTSPGFVIFPFIYWVVEDRFPTRYFVMWGISIVFWGLAGATFTDDDRR